jgi:two-component system LytT family response regulator
MITATIVDDEAYSCESLANLLERYCPEVKVLDICYSAGNALQSIKEQKPQILFLDIEMPHMNGFELLEKLPSLDFELIFTTSYDQYAIKAFRFSALDYLLKPVDREELQKAVKKVVDRRQNPLPQQLEILVQRINQPQVLIQRIALPGAASVAVVLQEHDTHQTLLWQVEDTLRPRRSKKPPHRSRAATRCRRRGRATPSGGRPLAWSAA